MNAPYGKKAAGDDSEGAEVHRMRFTLTSKNTQRLEKISDTLVRWGKSKMIPVKGPVRMPTKTLRLTVRKSPCGNGTSTFDRFEMRIHKRVIDFTCNVAVIKQISAMLIEPSVDVEVTFA